MKNITFQVTAKIAMLDSAVTAVSILGGLGGFLYFIEKKILPFDFIMQFGLLWVAIGWLFNMYLYCFVFSKEGSRKTSLIEKVKYVSFFLLCGAVIGAIVFILSFLF